MFIRSSEHATETRCVLLVHGNDLFREALALLLEWQTSFKESIQARSLEEAHRALANGEERTNLVIVDLDHLPKPGGRDLLSDLADSLGVPVLGLTSGRNPGVRARALETGVSEVLSTAGSAEKIVAAARRLGEG